MSGETENDKKLILDAYEELIKHCKRSRGAESKQLIEKAFHFAWDAHRGVRRKSGEPYIIHPIEVAEIAAKEIGLGTKSIVSALLHDVVEDTEYTVEDIAHHFGDKVAAIVDGLTKISGAFNQQTSMQAENFRKMLLTLSDDIRVIILKIADRLHNMRTLSSMPLRKQMKIAGETLFLFAPLALRMGLYAIKSELEDLSLKYEHPDDFKLISEKITEQEERQEKIIKRIIAPLKEKLKEGNIKCSIKNRPRSIFSIWNKIQTQNTSIEEIYDMISVRVVFEPEKGIPEKNQCWNIYSLITDIYKPKPERIRDWMSTPKANGYEALHVTAMGPQGNWVEFQIRTDRMDDIAEKGFAVHSKYSDGSGESELDKWLKDVREILENPESDALAFLDEFRLNLFSQEIQVFTPKGLIKTLPKHASALDFAYEIHTDIGNQCIGAKVNHKLVPLNYILRSGDQVEILTSDKQKPKSEWLEYVVTAKAKSKIKSAFKKERKEYTIKGARVLEDKLVDSGLKLNAKAYRKMLEHYKLSNKEELYYKIGLEKIKLDEIEDIVKKKSKNKFIKYWKLQLFGDSKEEEEEILETATSKPEVDKKKTLMLNELAANESYRIAPCCKPIPGDDVLGYVDMANNVTIHKRKCPNALKLMSSQGDRILEANWTSHRLMSFLAIIELNGIDKIGIVNDITSVISKDHHVNMRSVHFESHDGVFEGLIHLYVHNTEDLNNLMKKLIKIKGLDNVRRIENIEEYS
ncbi:RelA/SpoT family protein [Labilibaculum sp. DW002]|uniref:RelA/SpoT family protein n=1 Tax=Paralabilibaculum antarcticum TaxID=2912572 RepID=A0ABT5VR26_9BACT|nr:RelA/SpoT family protein [Labilibaculum sp. DW002]MDE5417873.1 RelA/SpoT family protein [Labilibaculum sp. DW002]